MNGDQLINDLVKKLSALPDLSVAASNLSRMGKIYSLNGSLEGYVYLKAIATYPHRWGITRNTINKLERSKEPWSIILLYDSDHTGYVISSVEYRDRVAGNLWPFHQGDYKITEGKSLKAIPHFTTVEQLLSLLDLELTKHITVEKAIEQAKKQAQRIRKQGAGESASHKALKTYVANNPACLGLNNVISTHQEYAFPSGDQVDVAFESQSNDWTVVEIELQGLAETLIGLFQCVKYKALQEAVLKSQKQVGSVNSVLVANSIPREVRSIAELLDIKIFEIQIETAASRNQGAANQGAGP